MGLEMEEFQAIRDESRERGKCSTSGVGNVRKKGPSICLASFSRESESSSHAAAGNSD